MKPKRILRIIFSLLITIILVYFLLQQTNLNEIKTALQQIRLEVLMISFIIYGFAYFARTLRFWYLTKKISLKDFFKIVCIHNLFIGLLPFRTGELSLIYYGSKKGEKKTKLLAALIISRFFDLVSILIIFIVMIVLSGIIEKAILNIIIVVIILLSVFVIGIITSSRYFHIFKIKPLMNFKLYSYIIKKIEETLSYLKTLKNLKQSLITLLFSLMIWLFLYAESYLIIASLGITIGPYKIIMGLAFVAVISIIPIHGIINFGTMEAAWTIVYMFFGVSKELAISSGFGFHIINILFFSVLGIYGLLTLRKTQTTLS